MKPDLNELALTVFCRLAKTGGLMRIHLGLVSQNCPRQ